jgi:hypothetical protein
MAAGGESVQLSKSFLSKPQRKKFSATRPTTMMTVPQALETSVRHDHSARPGRKPGAAAVGALSLTAGCKRRGYENRIGLGKGKIKVPKAVSEAPRSMIFDDLQVVPDLQIYQINYISPLDSRIHVVESVPCTSMAIFFRGRDSSGVQKTKNWFLATLIIRSTRTCQ